MFEEILILVDLPLLAIVGYIYMFFRINKNGLSRRQFHAVRFVLVIVASLTLTEMLYELISYGYWNPGFLTLYIIDAFYNALLLFADIAWWIFGLRFLNKKAKILDILPYFLIVVGVAFFATQIGFYGTEEFMYFNGEELIYGAAPNWLGYFGVSYQTALTVFALVNFLSRKEYANRAISTPILIGTTILGAMCYVQVFLPFGMFLIGGHFIALLIVYLSLNSARVLTDEVTGLGNRQAMIRETEKMRTSGKVWFWSILDIDGFGKIISSFGREESERALKSVAEVLQGVGAFTKSKAFRIDSDRFTIIGECSERKDIEDIIAETAEEIDNKNRIARMPYSIKFSYGYVFVDKDKTVTIPTVTKEATKNMLDMKKTRKIEKTYGY